MSNDTLLLTKRADIQALAARIASTGHPSAPLYKAAAEGRIALLMIEGPESSVDIDAMARFTRPVTVLINGDPGWGEPTYGPGRWRCVKQLSRWAAAAVVHGAAGMPEHYADAVLAAEEVKRLLFIETTSALVAAWRTYLPRVPTLVIAPPAGSVHPIPPTVRH